MRKKFLHHRRILNSLTSDIKGSQRLSTYEYLAGRRGIEFGHSRTRMHREGFGNLGTGCEVEQAQQKTL
jgi:hypothetical protein